MEPSTGSSLAKRGAPLLARCAPNFKEHGVLKFLAIEAKLDRSIDKAYLVLTLRRPRFRRLATGWAQRAPDGLLIWSCGEEEVWEWIIPGSNVPQEVIYAEVFGDAQSQGDHASKLGSAWRLGHFEVDLVALDQKVEDQLPRRLVSHFFTPSEAVGDSNTCFVGKVRLSLQVSWERRGQRTAELRRQTKEVNQLVDEVLQEERLELVNMPDPHEAEERLLAEQLAESRLKAALRRQQEFQEEWHCDSVRKGISMTQWVSKELWEQRCGDETEEEEMLCPPQELLAEQLIWWRKRLHEVEMKCSARKQRRPSSPRRSTTRLERHRLGPCVAVPDQLEVHATCPSTMETLPGDARSSSYSLSLEALLEHRRSPRGLDLCEDGTSEVGRFLRQHRGLPEATPSSQGNHY